VPAFDLVLRSSWAYQAFRPDFPNEIKSHPNRQKLENSSKKFLLLEQFARNPGSLFHRLIVSADF